MLDVTSLPLAMGANASLTTLQAFANHTWIENLYVLDNGSLLASTVSHPVIYHIDPNRAQLPGSEPTVAYTFANATSTLGLAELSPGIFAVVVGNMSAATLEAVPGTFRIEILDVSPERAPTLLASNALPATGLLNGLITLPGAPGYLLVADSDNGCVWRLNAYSGAIDHFADPLFAKAPNVSSSALNGIRVPSLGPGATAQYSPWSATANSSTSLPPGATYLYFSNSNTNIFGRIPITRDGMPLTTDTRAEKLVSALNHTSYDDFQLSPDGSFALIASWTADSLYWIDTSSLKQIVAAGYNGDGALDHPTSVHWANSELTAVYMTTAGYFATFGGTTGGQVVKMELKL